VQHLSNNFRESLASAAGNLWRRVTSYGPTPDRSLHNGGQGLGDSEFWALRDIHLEVDEGEILGIIGRNGAGKSTLLRILSRITPPTCGTARYRGRMASLLEIGTGFHRELTGRENTYLNGAILGMRRHEVTRKLGEIVEFAGISRFLDTPVKFYSSGMYMRLGFAVAAHLDADILLVDEVLAVGDAFFRKKCLGKMREVSQGGRTVLLVSHNMSMMGQSCNTAMVLHQGEQHFRGNTASAIQCYLALGTEESECRRSFPVDASKPFQVLEIYTANVEGKPTARFDIADAVLLSVRYRVTEKLKNSNLMILLSRNGTEVFCSFDTDAHPARLRGRSPGTHSYRVRLPRRLLKAGFYTVTVGTGVINQMSFETVSDAIAFQIEELSEDTSWRGCHETRPGMVMADVTWEAEE